MKGMFAILFFVTVACHTIDGPPPLTEEVIERLKAGIRDGDLYTIHPIMITYQTDDLLKFIKHLYFFRPSPNGPQCISYLRELRTLTGLHRKSTTQTAIDRPDK